MLTLIDSFLNPSENDTEDNVITNNAKNYEYLSASIDDCGLSSESELIRKLIDGVIDSNRIRSLACSFLESGATSCSSSADDGGACCPVDSLPRAWRGSKGAGEEFSIGDLPTYVVGENSMQDGKAVICIYDIYGFRGGRIREICDELAEEGYLVILPDFFRGEAWLDDQGTSFFVHSVHHKSNVI